MVERRWESPEWKLSNNDNSHYQEQDWYNKPHSELVKAFAIAVQQTQRELIDMAEQGLDDDYVVRKGETYQAPIVNAIRYELYQRSLFTKPNQSEKFLEPLAFAWDVLAYDQYQTGSLAEYWAGRTLSRERPSPLEQTIKLTDPMQVKIPDALADVAGITHQKGQSNIPIPEKLKNYGKYRSSPEYQERLARARQNRYRPR